MPFRAFLWQKNDAAGAQNVFLELRINAEAELGSSCRTEPLQIVCSIVDLSGRDGLDSFFRPPSLITEMEPIQTSPCPFCETPLQVLHHQVGNAVQCPYCQTPLRLELDDQRVPFFRESDMLLDELPMMTPKPAPGQAPPAKHLPAVRDLGGACYNCGSMAAVHTRSQMSQAGLIVMVVMLMVCFPLFFIGLMMKETYYVCPSCGVRRGSAGY